MTSINVIDQQIIVHARFVDRARCKAVEGAKWHPSTKTWRYPASPAAALALITAFNGIRLLEVDTKFDILLKQMVETVKAGAIKDVTDLPDHPSKTPSWMHQRQAFAFARNLPATLLAMDMGTGKSKVAIDLVNEWGCRFVLVTCPLSVCNVWPREFRKHSLRDYKVLVLNKGTVPKKMQAAKLHVAACAAKRQPCVVVVNHESLWRSAFGEWLLKGKDGLPDLMIVDESHRAKTPKGRFSKFLATISLKIPRRLMLTGTPMPHSPLDIFAQYRFLDAGIFGWSFNRFKLRYAVLGGWQGKEVLGFQRQDELNQRIYQIGYRITKAEAMPWLPEQVFEDRYCAMSEKDRKIYESMERDFYTAVEAGEVTASNALVKLLRLQQITSGYIKTDEGVETALGQHKQALLYETIEEIPKGEPIVVFVRFIHDLESVCETAVGCGLTYGEISGRRKDLTDDATMPEDIDVLGVQIQSGGLGIDLSRAAYAIYYSPGYSLGDYQQSLSRLHRKGQTRTVVYLNLICEDTIDGDVYEALRRKEDVIEAILTRRPVDAE